MNSGTRLSCAIVAFALLAALSPPASAGEFGIEGQLGYFSLSATKTADAVLDSSGGLTFGGAVRYSFEMGLYVNGGVRTWSQSGQRVFLASPTDPVNDLGFPLEIRLTPWFVNAGYRFRQGSKIVPYAGAGIVLNQYKEDSSVAGIPYDESFTKTGFQVVGGVEVGTGRFRFGGEFAWSTVPDAVGAGGVSQVYGEDDIGGWSVVGKVIIAIGTGRSVPDDLGPIP